MATDTALSNKKWRRDPYNSVGTGCCRKVRVQSICSYVRWTILADRRTAQIQQVIVSGETPSGPSKGKEQCNNPRIDLTGAILDRAAA